MRMTYASPLGSRFILNGLRRMRGGAQSRLPQVLRTFGKTALRRGLVCRTRGARGRLKRPHCKDAQGVPAAAPASHKACVAPNKNPAEFFSCFCGCMLSLSIRMAFVFKPIEQLVPVSYTHYCASTPGLSTWWSSTALKGELVSRGVSRLDAFSGYPVRI